MFSIVLNNKGCAKNFTLIKSSAKQNKRGLEINIHMMLVKCEMTEIKKQKLGFER